MLTELGPGHGGADDKPAVFVVNLPGFLDLLDVDDEIGRDDAGTELHEQIGAPGKDAPPRASACKKAHCSFDGFGGLISHSLSPYRLVRGAA